MLRDTVFIYLTLINVSSVDDHFHTVQYFLSPRNYEFAKNLVNTYAFLIGSPFFVTRAVIQNYITWYYQAVTQLGNSR